jgi:hypothetical protein
VLFCPNRCGYKTREQVEYLGIVSSHIHKHCSDSRTLYSKGNITTVFICLPGWARGRYTANREARGHDVFCYYIATVRQPAQVQRERAAPLTTCAPLQSSTAWARCGVVCLSFCSAVPPPFTDAVPKQSNLQYVKHSNRWIVEYIYIGHLGRRERASMRSSARFGSNFLPETTVHRAAIDLRFIKLSHDIILLRAKDGDCRSLVLIAPQHLLSPFVELHTVPT